MTQHIVRDISIMYEKLNDSIISYLKLLQNPILPILFKFIKRDYILSLLSIYQLLKKRESQSFVILQVFGNIFFWTGYFNDQIFSENSINFCAHTGWFWLTLYYVCCPDCHISLILKFRKNLRLVLNYELITFVPNRNRFNQPKSEKSNLPLCCWEG